MPQTDRSTLIVGAGLAGCLMAWRFQQTVVPYKLIGSTTLPCAADVAAGVINPVTGRWMTKSWNFDALLPVARELYADIETALTIKVYHPVPEIRFCQNEDDAKRSGRRIRNPRYANVLGSYRPAGEAAPEFNDLHGSFEIIQAAYVDLPKLVTALRTHFTEKGCFADEVFKHSELKRNTDGWHYQGVSYERVIFCEGAAVKGNPWFQNLPLKPIKGETLLCEIPNLRLPNWLYHHKKWLLSYPDGRVRIGATYDENDLSPEPTEAARAQLLEDAKAALKGNHQIEVKEQLAGIRPSSIDNLPIIGEHPEQHGLFLLNGLGSKGASTAPTMTQQLLQHIRSDTAINSEVALNRF